jgi:hypothetical protein
MAEVTGGSPGGETIGEAVGEVPLGLLMAIGAAIGATGEASGLDIEQFIDLQLQNHKLSLIIEKNKQPGT